MSSEATSLTNFSIIKEMNKIVHCSVMLVLCWCVEFISVEVGEGRHTRDDCSLRKEP